MDTATMMMIVVAMTIVGTLFLPMALTSANQRNYYTVMNKIRHRCQQNRSLM